MNDDAKSYVNIWIYRHIFHLKIEIMCAHDILYIMNTFFFFVKIRTCIFYNLIKFYRRNPVWATMRREKLTEIYAKTPELWKINDLYYK